MDTVVNDPNMIRLIVGFVTSSEIKIGKISDLWGDVSSLLCISSKWRDVVQSRIASIDVKFETSEQFSQRHLNYIAHAFPYLQRFNMKMNYGIAPYLRNPMDFTLVRFPELIMLTLNCVRIPSIHFDRQNAPKLKKLCILRTMPRDIYLHLDHLENLRLEDIMFTNASIDLGNSLSRCPNLQKFEGEMDLGSLSSSRHVIINESLKTLLLPGFEVEKLWIWAPKLSYLCLYGCDYLNHVRLLHHAPRDHMTANARYVDYAHIAEDDKPLEIQEKFQVDLTESKIDEQSWQHLKAHPRYLRKMPGNFETFCNDD